MLPSIVPMPSWSRWGSNLNRLGKRLREVQETLAVRVLAIGPSTNAQVILQTLHEGAYKYIDIERVVDLPAALRRVRAEPPLAVQYGRVISVLGASGGCGASTIAVNIAMAYCHAQQRSVLIDLNLEGGDLAVLLRLQPSYSIADFCQNVDRMDGSMFETCLVSDKNGLALLSPPQRYQDIGKVTVRGVRKAITMARNQFPYVVVDVDGSLPQRACPGAVSVGRWSCWLCGSISRRFGRPGGCWLIATIWELLANESGWSSII